LKPISGGKHLAAIVFGCGVSFLFAGNLVIFCFRMWPTWPPRPGSKVVNYIADVFIMSSMISLVCFVPAALFVILTEFRKYTRWEPYAVAGSVIGVLPLLVLGTRPEEKYLYIIAVVGGSMCGLIYWLIAGRHAGLWRKTAV
jgi:hypothetical protein